MEIKRKRRLMKKSWSLQRAEVLVGMLNERGLTLPVDRAVELIEDRIVAVTTTLSIQPKSARVYLDDEGLAGLADSIAEMLADEEPGEDLVDAIRDCPVPVGVAARTITALAEAGRVRLPTGGYEAADDALRLVSLWGLMLFEGNRQGDLHRIDVPEALLIRSIRRLEAAAALLDDRPGSSRSGESALSSALHGDARVLLLLLDDDSPALLMTKDEWLCSWVLAATEWPEAVTRLRHTGIRDIEASPRIWSRLHRGSSTGDTVHVFLHQSQTEALQAAADFAVEALGSDVASQLYRTSRFEELCRLYERTHRTGNGILRVEWALPEGDLIEVDGVWRSEPTPDGDPTLIIDPVSSDP